MIEKELEISRLSEIREGDDIKSLSHAIFPGTHCPLFGVAMIASFVEDLVVLVVGTQECTYYVKDFAYQRQKGMDNFYSLVSDKHDITFGSEEKIKEAVRRIDRELNPKAIMLVSTCVLEIIGEDFPSIAESLRDEVSAKILVVPTEHFKCSNHIPGMERSLEQLVLLMEDRLPDKKAINILGHRQEGIEDTELFKILEEEGVRINSIIPSRSSVDSLADSARAGLNIVTDFVAEPLARAMEERFNIPYIYFDKHLSPGKIRKKYSQMERILDINILDKLVEEETRLLELMEEARKIFTGQTFVYGNTPMMAFEFTSFMIDLGLEPILVQVRDIYPNDSFFMDEIRLGGHDPLVSKIANIAAIDDIYDSYRPNFYIGHENPFKLAKKGIIQLTLDEGIKKLGYQLPIYIVERMLLAHEQFEDSRLKMMAMMGEGGR